MLKAEAGGVQIGALDGGAEMGEAVGVMVRDMCDNPNIVAAFGRGRLPRNRQGDHR